MTNRSSIRMTASASYQASAVTHRLTSSNPTGRPHTALNLAIRGGGAGFKSPEAAVATQLFAHRIQVGLLQHPQTFPDFQARGGHGLESGPRQAFEGRGDPP